MGELHSSFPELLRTPAWVIELAIDNANAKTWAADNPASSSKPTIETLPDGRLIRRTSL